MLDISKDIQSLTKFKRDTNKVISQLKRTGNPVVLTVNGSASVVVQDAAAYQKLLDLVDRIQAIEGVQRGLEAMKRGDQAPAAMVMERIRKKYKITTPK